MSNIDTNALKIVLAQLAAQANLSTLQKSGPSLPNGWSNLSTFKSSSTLPPPIPPTQGFLSMGPVGDTNIVVLALGMTWVSYLQNKFDALITQLPLPSQIAKDAPAGAMMDSTFINAYLQIQTAVWNSLQYLNNQPLYICGISLGGPLAQIAALDLRPGNKGPGNVSAPPGPTPSYVFSTGNTANKAFAGYYNRTLQNAYTVQAGSAATVVDMFPTSPANDDFTTIGMLQMAAAKIPAVDVPWLERGDTFYLQALGGIPFSGPTIPASIPNPPAGFSQVLAYTLAGLTAASYHLAQHPESMTPDISPYTLDKIITSGDVPYAYIYTSTENVVVSFRGSITWGEFSLQDANANFSTPLFGEGQVQTGAYNVYTTPVTIDDELQENEDEGDDDIPLFSEALKAELKLVTPGKKLFLTGHGLGGTLANIAAMDLTNGDDKLTVNAVYTFGGVYPGNSDFTAEFNDLLGSKSYQINRPSDKIGAAGMFRGFTPVGTAVTLNGQMAIEESTRHSLDGYLKLLNPNS